MLERLTITQQRRVDPLDWQELIPFFQAVNARHGYYLDDMLAELATARFILWHYGARSYEIRKRFPVLHERALSEKGKSVRIMDLDAFFVDVFHAWAGANQRQRLKQVLADNPDKADWPFRFFPHPNCKAGRKMKSGYKTLAQAAFFRPRGCSCFDCICNFHPELSRN